MADENSIHPEDEIMQNEKGKEENTTKVKIDEKIEKVKNVVEEKSKKVTSKKINKLFFKILFVIIPIFVIIYIIFFSSTKSDVTLLLSSSDIANEEIDNRIIFPINRNIYFYIKGRDEIINAEYITIEIHYFDESNYKLYRDIKFGIDKNFKKLSSYLQGEYFSKKGKYKINIYLDANLKASKEILIE